MQTLRCLVIFLVLSAALMVHVCAAQRITRMSDRRAVDFTQMIADVKTSKVIFIGETHDEKRHHDMQLKVIRTLHRDGIPLAIGLEMFSTESQLQLAQWTEGKISEQAFRRVYAENWSEEWLLYRDIFIFARDNRIPMIALNIPKQIVYKVAEQGFKSLRPEEKKDLPPDVTCVLNTPYTDFLRKVYARHPSNDKAFTYFCEAQTLRNNGMAWNIAKYVKIHPENSFVTLSGALHAVRNGIPEQLSRYTGAAYKVILPELPGFGAEDASSRDADFFVSW